MAQETTRGLTCLISAKATPSALKWLNHGDGGFACGPVMVQACVLWWFSAPLDLQGLAGGSILVCSGVTPAGCRAAVMRNLGNN